MTHEASARPPVSTGDGFHIGSTVAGRYVLRRELGRGGAALVFAAEHVLVRRYVAVKVPHADLEQREALAARLRRETQALARVRHPVVVDVIDAGESDGLPFLAMQLLEGRTLSGLVAARGRLSPEEVVKIGVALAAGLAAVHAAGILHRDVKPSNVLVTRDPTNQIRLFDFGVARLGGGQEPVDNKLTQMGAILGTPEYMAPESLLGRPDIDHRSDIYSLGVSLYECLTGAVPFDGPLGQVLLRLTTTDPPPLSSVRPDVPKALADIIHHTLRREPGERPTSMDEVAVALSRCASQRAETVDVLGGATRARALPPPLPQSKPSAAAPAKPEVQRKLARAPYATLATLSRGPDVQDGAVDAKIEDVSEGGVLLVASEACNIGDVLRLKFALPISGRIMEVSAVVRWSRSSRGTRATGLEFQGLPDTALAEIRQYVVLMNKGS